MQNLLVFLFVINIRTKRQHVLWNIRTKRQHVWWNIRTKRQHVWWNIRTKRQHVLWNIRTKRQHVLWNIRTKRQHVLLYKFHLFLACLTSWLTFRNSLFTTMDTFLNENSSQYPFDGY